MARSVTILVVAATTVRHPQFEFAATACRDDTLVARAARRATSVITGTPCRCATLRATVALPAAIALRATVTLIALRIVDMLGGTPACSKAARHLRFVSRPDRAA